MAAAEYEFETDAAYDVLPDDGRIDVSVDVAFTNTTPDPDGQFSVFEEVLFAIQDGATAVTASDDEGDLDVSVEDDDGVTVATVELRDELRYEDTATFDLRL